MKNNWIGWFWHILVVPASVFVALCLLLSGAEAEADDGVGYEMEKIDVFHIELKDLIGKWVDVNSDTMLEFQ